MRRLNVRCYDNPAHVLGTLPAPEPGAYTARFALDGGQDALTLGLQDLAIRPQPLMRRELAYIADVSIDTLRQIRTFVEGDKV